MLVALAGLVGVGALCPASAAANEYTGMLAAGTISVGSGSSSGSAGFVYSDYSWTAPSGENFAGFAYTSGYFSSVSDSGVGGVSAGFGGDGSANQPTILFPWTQDCSITNSGHEWTANGQEAGTSHQQACNTAGNTGGWNYTNAEIDNTSPGTNPQAEYHTLWLTAFCQSSSCPYDDEREWGAAAAAVTNLSATIDDSYNQPAGGASWTGNNGGWYQTDTSSSPVINVSAADPGGVCAIGTWFTGPGSYYLQPMDASPGMENPGAPIGNEFDSIAPCPGGGGGTVSGSSALPGGMASGTYNLSVIASNPGNWEAGAGLSNAPTIASYGSTINVDDTVPTISWANASGNWTSATTERFSVSAGPSGISGVSCTDNGTPVAATSVGGGSYQVATASQGANVMSCTASNNDANGALTSPAATMTYHVDTTVPTVTFTDNGYTPGTWSGAAQTVTVAATGGPSGIDSTSCYLDGAGVSLGGTDSDQVTVSGDGQHVLHCLAISNTNITGGASYDVWVDTRQPTVSFSGAQESPAWLSGTPTVVVIGGEDGGMLSGITTITCTVNDDDPVTMSVDAAQDYTSSFVLTSNGADVVRCQASDSAGTTGPAYSENVDVDDPAIVPASANLTRYGSSPLIDGGADPFSNGPSQTKWSRSPQAVTITANNTGGGAAIASISCTGAELGAGTTGTWPIDALNTDPQGGEQVTVTVQPPGGYLACTATDTARNTYSLGSYEFELDDTAPAGAFVAHSAWPEPDELELHVTDSGSGVQYVRVYAQPNQGGKAIDLGFAQHDPKSGDYVVEVDDGTMSPGEYTFYANVSDNAGNTGQVTASPDGGAEQLQLPLRADTALTLQSDGVTGVQDAAAPSALGTVALSAELDAARVARATAARAPTGVAASASYGVRRSGCKPRLGKKTCAKAKTKPTPVLDVPYDKTVRLAGVLRKRKHANQVIAHATIDIYQQVDGSGKITLLGKTRTERAGRYSYLVKGSASRVVFALYRGTEKLRSAVSQIAEHFRGNVSLNINNVQAGGWLEATGAVGGGHIPTGGVEVTVHYCQVGLPGCGLLGTIRTDARGRYSFRQHFSAATRGLRYRLWVTVPSGQSGWPYNGASSATVIRRVT